MLLPPGFHFRPTEQELIKFYLRNKVVGKTILPPELNGFISDKILYGEKAEEPSKLFAGRSEEYLYFFTEVNKKFANGNGNYMDRIAGNAGTWKMQKTYEVLDDNRKTLIGYRKNLSFTSKNKQEEEKINKLKEFIVSYTMNEFNLKKYPPSSSSQNHQAAAEWTVCKIRKKVTKNKNYQQPSSSVLSMPIKQGKGRKRARTSSHELMLQSASLSMPTHQQEQKCHHPCAKSLQTSSNYDQEFESQTDSTAYQLADTHTPAVAMSSMTQEENIKLPEFSQPHQSDYFAAQPDHERLFSSLGDLPVKLPHLEQESKDDVHPLNTGQNFTSMLLANNNVPNMLPNSTITFENAANLILQLLRINFAGGDAVVRGSQGRS